MASKQRWYQAWEHTKHKETGPLGIFRQYNHMHGSWNEAEIGAVRAEWLDGFLRAGIDFSSLACEPVTWWDREVAQLISEHVAAHFRKIAIWDKDWVTFARQLGLNGADFNDPRSAFEKAAHRLLILTQKRRTNLAVRAFERILRMRGW